MTPCVLLLYLKQTQKPTVISKLPSCDFNICIFWGLKTSFNNFIKHSFHQIINFGSLRLFLCTEIQSFFMYLTLTHFNLRVCPSLLCKSENVTINYFSFYLSQTDIQVANGFYCCQLFLGNWIFIIQSRNKTITNKNRRLKVIGNFLDSTYPYIA